MPPFMWIPPALAMGLLLAPAPPPRPGQETITVGSLHLRIPDLPMNVADAKARHRSLLRQMEQDLADVEKALKEVPPPGTAPLRIPASQAAEARRLLDHLRDPVYAQLERAMALRLEALVAAQAAAQSAPAPSTEPSQVNPPSAPAKSPLPQRSTAVIPGAAEYGLTDLGRAHHDLQEGGDEKGNQELTREIRFRTDQRTMRAQQDRRTLNVWDRELPALTEAWDALTRHLTQQAVRGSELLAATDPSRDPGVETLKLRVQQQLLQRYQASLRICRELWRSVAG